MQSEKLGFHHYKNGIFNGYYKQQRAQGQAICLYDNGALFLGQYHASQPNGKCLIMIGPQIYFMGSLRKGMLDGPFVVRSPQLHIYSRAAMNNVEGEIVVIDRKNRRARVWEIQNAEGTCIREGEYDEFLPQDKILRAISPYTEMFPSLSEYLADSSFAQLVQRRSKQKDKFQVSLVSRDIKKVSAQFERQRLSGVGVCEEGEITGLGYMFDSSQGLEIQGQIYKGVLDGEGLKRQLSTGKSIFGKFSKGDIRSLQAMQLKGESIESRLVQLKRRIHLHALEFSNDYLNQRPVYLIRNFYQSIVENEASYTRFLRSDTRGKKTVPLRFTRGLQTPAKQDELSHSISEFNSIKTALSRR